MAKMSAALVALAACLLATQVAAQCPAGTSQCGKDCIDPSVNTCFPYAGGVGGVIYCPKGECICPYGDNSLYNCFDPTAYSCPGGKSGINLVNPGGLGLGGANCVGTGAADPVFTGFDGQAFSFDGIPGQIFNLISEQNHQLNALFTFTEMSVHNGTTMSAIGLKVGPHAVVVHVNPGSSLTALVDGKEINTALLQNSVRLEAPPVNVTYEMFRPSYGHSIEVVTSGMRFLIYSTKPYTDEGGVRVQSYLNFESTVLRVPVDNKIHGVMGQSYHRAHPVASTRSEDPQTMDDGDDVSLLDINQRSSLLEVPGDSREHGAPNVLPCTGLVEGDEVDYIVSTLTGDDFKYNLFNPASDRSARRLMAAGAPARMFLVASFGSK